MSEREFWSTWSLLLARRADATDPAPSTIGYRGGASPGWQPMWSSSHSPWREHCEEHSGDCVRDT
jgi:hypothetical protein